MNTVLIAGAGQLGSRHLQGVKTSKNKLDIWVYDLSEESLKVAEERYNQVPSEVLHSVHFITSISEVPTIIDIVIVASSSKPRAAIVSDIVSSKDVKYLVLEKFLFTRVSEYDEIQSMLENKKVKTWVNCPRRMWDGYNEIARLLDSSLPVIMKYENKDWGLCCNSIHFIDIFMWLSHSSRCDINIDGLIPEIIESKRNGYVELRGHERITTDNGSILELTSSIESEGASDIIINNGNLIVKYNESAGKLIINGKETKVSVHYQSGLSGILVDQLLSKGNCQLSTYTESKYYHLEFLKKVGPFINKITGWTSDSCPIT